MSAKTAILREQIFNLCQRGNQFRQTGNYFEEKFSFALANCCKNRNYYIFPSRAKQKTDDKEIPAVLFAANLTTEFDNQLF